MDGYKITDPEILRGLCIKNGWFTGGTNEQYAKLFELNRNLNYKLEDLALAIWMCSDGVPYSEICSRLHDAHDEYLANRAYAEQAARERAADEVYCGYFD